ncbi:MAG: DUF192 domain-containing protein, partial [Candidatus Peregrinibacteria bacterium]|nr:DUF192 domain-containing protein [Candidatus Peregrinibacteria bacterium]
IMVSMKDLFIVSLVLSSIAGAFAVGYWYAGGYDFNAGSDLEDAGFVLAPLSVTTSKGKVYEFDVAIADESDEKKIGLQVVQSLKSSEGMWFVFDEPGERVFWMKDMVISLDILFVSSDFEIVSMVEDVPPCSEVDPEQGDCPRYSSVDLAQYVLELPAGTTERYEIDIGDLVGASSL